TITVDVSNLINPDSRSVVIQVENHTSTTHISVNAWKYGTPESWRGDMSGKTQLWALIPLDDNQRFQMSSSNWTGLDMWIMGYGGREVAGFPALTPVTPSVNGVWETKTVPAEAIGAKAALVTIVNPHAAKHWDIKHPDSTDNFYSNSYAGWVCALVGLNASGQFKIKVEEKASIHAYLLGYITGNDVFIHINNLAIPDPPVNTWTPYIIKHLAANPNLAVLRSLPSGGTSCFSARKGNSLRDIQRGGNNGIYFYVHCNPGYRVDLRRLSTYYHYKLAAEIQ
ncbi:unnamed protein product, partial [marine sediment metagenome]